MELNIRPHCNVLTHENKNIFGIRKRLNMFPVLANMSNYCFLTALASIHFSYFKYLRHPIIELSLLPDSI